MRLTDRAMSCTRPQDSRETYLSLIIPAFNEETRIGKSLDRILVYLQSRPYTSEVIIVDDGSSDRTGELVKARLGDDPRIALYRHHRNLGKGQAVKRGMLLASGEYLFFSDADLSVPIETLAPFLSSLEEGFDVTVGSRQAPGAIVEVHQPPYREMMGKIFTRLCNRILGLQVTDFTCGFKGFRRDVARDLFSRQRLRAWSFDAEILYLAHRAGYRLLELPVTWRNDRATKVRLWKDIATSFAGLMIIRANGALRRYK